MKPQTRDDRMDERTPGFAPGDFFELDGWAHAAIFDPSRPVWDALRLLGNYLEEALRPGIHPGAQVMEGAILVGEEIEIGAGCVVEAGAFLRGPLILGEGCEVRHGAYLRGGIVAGKGCVLGHASEFKNCILLDGAKAPHFNYVGDSILGRRVNMGAGSKLSNVKITHGNVSVRAGDHTIDSGLRKFGAILGDDVEIGCNAVLNPGAMVGPRSSVYPNACVRGYLPAGTILRLRQEMDARPRRD
jgi:UDP-N-acetylglucosamine diphosphorylase / glucose-1-phosphate thymidylyltransferase / UDP-N-acetylgalactosamine diphosphorylase / glucosamine-1-phosphate N-acetyltransferase / galactosamine-1-phosphate N-acetyltransferase